MGNRILKDTIRINRRIDALSYFEEVVFYRLITAADDFGVYSANPVMLARTLFPLRESVDGKMMEAALRHLEELGLVRCYSVKDEGDWLQIVSWEKHQRLRNSRRVYPGPEEADGAPEEEQLPQEEGQTEQEQPEQAAEVLPSANDMFATGERCSLSDNGGRERDPSTRPGNGRDSSLVPRAWNGKNRPFVPGLASG